MEGWGRLGEVEGGGGEICELWESFGLEKFAGVWILEFEIGNWNWKRDLKVLDFGIGLWGRGIED